MTNMDICRENPLRKANVINKIFFWWLKDIIQRGKQNDFLSSDIYDTMPEDLSEPLRQILEIAWEKEINSAKLKSVKPSLSRVIIKTYCWKFLQFASLQVLHMIILMTQPKLLEKIMLYFDSKSRMPTSEAYTYATTSIALMALQIVLLRYSIFRLQRLGMQIKVAVSSLIFKKITKLPCSSTSLNESASAISLLSIDVGRFEILLASLTFVATIPLQFVGVTYLVYSYIGLIASLTGVLMMFQIIPLQTLYYKLATKWRAEQAAITDARLSLIDEVVASVRVVKMYVWESYFEKLVCKARSLEIQKFMNISYFDSAIQSILLVSHRISLFFGSVVLCLQNKAVTTEQMLPARQLFHNLRKNLEFNFIGVQAITNSRVSIKRIEKFLCLPEMKSRVKKIDDLTNSGKISIEKVTAFWDETTEETTLLNINVEFLPGKHCAILGKTGSGKSSLLKLMLGELEPYSGQVSVTGEISYASQEPWLFNASIRENILFGESYDMEHYDEIISACALVDDFNNLPHGDRTLVGDRGMSLSGGQRARINLARAAYRRADIYLLDDPFSAVDVRVAETLKSQCIDGLLKNKTVILVTHNVHHVNKDDFIILLKSGKIQSEGSVLSTHKSHENAQPVSPSEWKSVESAEKLDDYTYNGKEDLLKVSVVHENTEPNKNEESFAKGTLSISVFWKYISAGRYVNFFVVLAAHALPTALMCKFDFDNTAWTEESNHFLGNNTLKLKENFDSKTSDIENKIPMRIIYNFTYTLALFVATTILKNILSYRFVYETNRTLHNNMFANLIKTTIHFFDLNPAGRILNRFSEDTSTIDNALCLTLVCLMNTAFYTLGSLLFILIINWWNAFPITLSSLLFIKMSYVCLAAVPKIRRLLAIAKSPVLDFVTSTLAGLTTIRSCKAENFALKEFSQRLDKHTAAHFLVLASNIGFVLWIEMTIVCLFGCTAYICIALKNSGILESEAGLTLITIYEITNMASYMARMFVEACAYMVCVERILQYIVLKPENSAEPKKPINQLLESWPSSGEIKFERVSLRYSDEDEPVLKDLSLTIKAGSKVGIVGRTGAGKSSLITALFRLAKVEGQLIIDDVDTQKIDLSDIRSKISILPQEPILFSASLRSNLDPLNEFDDALLWSALDSVGLKSTFSSLDQVVEKAGKNLSLGQRQLLCLARVVLKDNKILVLDEATASVDSATDEQIQKVIREKFESCTVLVIAHRLNTIMDSDKVLVMDHGKVVEFDHPHLLLQNNEGYFSKMVEQAGEMMSQQLKAIAQNAYNLLKMHPTSI